MENEFKYDVLKMYFGEDYWVTDYICIKQPTIQDIIDYGESDFWSVVTLLCANPTQMRLQLWDIGLNWNKMSDYDLFKILILNLPQSKTSILFGDLDFTKFRAIHTDDEQVVLISTQDPLIQIDEEIYNRLVGYLRVMFDIHPKVEKAKNKSTMEAIIDEERMNLNNELKKQKKSNWKKSVLFPLISAAVNHPGFKYKKTELKEIGIMEFMDSIKRLQLYENTTSLMTGMYMGMLDTKSINLSKELNWARDLYED